MLDLNLPLIDGLELCARWRAQDIHTPVLFIARRARLEDRLRALDIGDDWVLMKPLVTDELIARMRDRPRRTCQPEPSTAAARSNCRRRSSACCGFFSSTRGQVLSRSQILQSIWGPNHPSRKVVDVYVGYLRRKLPDSVSIRTVRSLGYVLEPTTFA